MRAIKGITFHQPHIHEITLSNSIQGSFSHGQAQNAHLHPTARTEVEPLISSCSDPAVKQILLIMDEKENFIIEDLDEHHIVAKVECEWRVRQDLETEVSFFSNHRLFLWFSPINYYSA